MSALSSNTAAPSGVPGKKLFRKKLKVFNGQQHVTCMLKSLNWHTLEYRRNNSSLMYFYKIRNALVHVDHHHLISTRNLNYLIPHSKDPATRNDFVNDIVNDAGVFHRRRWNSTIVTISSKLDMLTFDRR